MATVWWHPWVKVERSTRAILADRLAFGASKTVDAVLAGVIGERRRIEQAGWFNRFQLGGDGVRDGVQRRRTL